MKKRFGLVFALGLLFASASWATNTPYLVSSGTVVAADPPRLVLLEGKKKVVYYLGDNTVLTNEKNRALPVSMLKPGVLVRIRFVYDKTKDLRSVSLVVIVK